ncbi:MAG: hypothetical protein RIB84_16020 [Sneathiellaceae bacterium]
MGAGNRRGRTQEGGSRDGRTGTALAAGHRRFWRLLLLGAFAGLAGPGAAAAQTDNAAPPAAVDCNCRVSFSYADPQRYRYWRREVVHADLRLRLSAAEGDYRTSAESVTAVCEDVREERKGEPFRSVDMCIELGQWLARIREEARCTLSAAADGKTAAECRLPDPDPKAGPFLTSRQTGDGAAAAMCNAYAHMVELRLAADIAAFEADNLHGLPALEHDHICLPR